MSAANSREHHSRRRPPSPSTATAALVPVAFIFTGWMLTQGYSPVVSVATTSAVMAVTMTLSRGRLVGFKPVNSRVGVLPPSETMVIWQEDAR
ncbi:hypothetical protein C8D88_101400 [Lentzea atacamensis]|uniref:Uncharacterized protein n=1 Tax=Lentzea atacamensis TaxID=531938 RepID=A0A316ID90_9PSEU|nr:hypothetical protein [Lentzea atacamensis]PWK90384.1 hypothetical protein C8D88_101400 [Lentzea atacamensis]